MADVEQLEFGVVKHNKRNYESYLFFENVAGIDAVKYSGVRMYDNANDALKTLGLNFRFGPPLKYHPSREIEIASLNGTGLYFEKGKGSKSNLRIKMNLSEAITLEERLRKKSLERYRELNRALSEPRGTRTNVSGVILDRSKSR